MSLGPLMTLHDGVKIVNLVDKLANAAYDLATAVQRHTDELVDMKRRLDTLERKAP